MPTNLDAYIRDIPNFPKDGILFKDITPLLQSKEATQETLAALIHPFKAKHIDKIIGIESRGFFFAIPMAQALGAGFIPVRKPGKLPYQSERISYGLEYGTDALEIHTDAIKKGERVLIHDDVLATGGTAKAAADLCKRLGAEVVGFSFILEIEFLKGRDNLSGYPIHSVLRY
jgi:adenine phosphoribosyltransferase